MSMTNNQEGKQLNENVFVDFAHNYQRKSSADNKEKINEAHNYLKEFQNMPIPKFKVGDKLMDIELNRFYTVSAITPSGYTTLDGYLISYGTEQHYTVLK